MNNATHVTPDNVDILLSDARAKLEKLKGVAHSCCETLGDSNTDMVTRAVTNKKLNRTRIQILYTLSVVDFLEDEQHQYNVEESAEEEINIFEEGEMVL